VAAEADASAYAAAARQAEIVIFDHASAAYNAMLWQPRNFIELFSNQWWNGAFLSFASALRIELCSRLH
jgi:hypothetical protein